MIAVSAIGLKRVGAIALPLSVRLIGHTSVR